MYVIVNGSNNGPDDPTTTTGQTLISRIAQLHNYGVQVIGYVNNATPGVYAAMSPPQPDHSHSAAESASEAQIWRNSYGTDGTFFDLSWRVGADLNDTDLANAEGLAIATGWGCTTAMWNWSVPMSQAERYLQCIRMQVCEATFMIEETTQSLWPMFYSDWNWIFNYHPGHFVDVVNASSNSDAANDFNDMRQRAADGFFVTDRTDYNHLPNDMNLFLSNISHDNQMYSDFAGTEDPADPTDCPAPTAF
jgi:hypothetical protein